jgi:hypothetical protein
MEKPIPQEEKNKLMKVPCSLDPEDSFPLFNEQGKNVYKHELDAFYVEPR